MNKLTFENVRRAARLLVVNRVNFKDLRLLDTKKPEIFDLESLLRNLNGEIGITKFMLNFGISFIQG